MGGPYNIPRNYKGESKILFIFSTKSFLTTIAGGFIGIVLFNILKIFKLKLIGFICIVIFAFIGFAIGTFKVPEVKNFKFTQQVGGEPISDVILRWIKFKRNKNRIYVYKEEGNQNVK